MSAFFESYINLRNEKNFKAGFIFNADETMVRLGENQTKLAFFQGEPPPVLLDPGNKEHVTLLICVSASGYALKTLAIISRLTVPEFPPEVTSSFDITGNKKGWMTKEIFRNWLFNSFIPQVTYMREYCQANEPVLLILDNHVSRNDLDHDLLWSTYNLKILFIPAHTSHILQPLDLCVNNHFKKLLASIFEPIRLEDSQQRRIRLLTNTARVLNSTLTEHYIKLGWERTGLEPICPQFVYDSGFVRNVAPLNSNEAPAPVRAPKRRRGEKFSSNILINGQLAK